MKRLFVSSVLLLFLTMGFLGCGTDTENPASSLDKNDLTQLTKEQQTLLADLPTNLTQDEIVSQLAEIFPGQFVPADQKTIDANVHLAPFDDGGLPPGSYMGTLWLNWGYAYLRVYSFHPGKAGPLQDPGGANHMNYDFWSTNKRFVDREGGGKGVRLANIHVSLLKTSKSCLYLYDSESGRSSLKCLSNPFSWNTFNQISDAVL